MLLFLNFYLKVSSNTDLEHYEIREKLAPHRSPIVPPKPSNTQIIASPRPVSIPRSNWNLRFN